MHKYQIEKPTSILHFYADWNYVQIGISEVSRNHINNAKSKSLEIDSIQSVKGFLLDFIKNCYQEQVGETIVLHASNLVVLNQIIKNIIDKFYFRNESRL